jgi:hypothetical protein
MRGIFQPPELIIQRALYDGLNVAEANGVTLEIHPDVLADRLATGMVASLAHSCDPALLYKLLAAIGGPASPEEIRGMARAALERQARPTEGPQAHPVQTFGREGKAR